MELKISEILASKEGLMKVLKADLPVKVSYKLSKMVKVLDAELQNFEAKRMDILKKYGEPIESGKKYSVKTENVELFNKDVTELLNISVKLEVEPVSLKVLEEAGVKLSPIDVSNMEKFIDSEKS